VGKGKRSAGVIAAMVRHKCVYLGAVEGTAALMAQAVVSAEVIAYDELGPEAIHRLDIVDFPVVVVNDVQGRDLYTEGRSIYRR
jgi:fumarate hydratase subunit beta